MLLRLFRAAVFLAVTAAAQPKPDLKPSENRPPAPPQRNAAAQRNENVFFSRIDTNAQKELGIRLGDNVTAVTQPAVEVNTYTSEHGRPAAELSVLRPAAPVTQWHGELFETLQNSVFNARSFFQVGDLLPSRQNQYGGRFSGDVKGLGTLTGGITNRKIRGMVNGNVLVPLPSERTPLATDPAIRAVVQRFLAAYPATLPNRTDFDERALNTNSPQTIDELDANLRLDRDVAHGRLSLSHVISRQTVHAFQLVAGQNPDTEIHGHRARATYRREFSANFDAAFGAGFTRGRSNLRSEPNAVGPRVRMGYQIEELGPDSEYPIDRATNTYRAGAVFRKTVSDGKHVLTWGGDFYRYQLNGTETNNQRGLFLFISNYGRTAIENLRVGAPSQYEVTLGPMGRGYRNWEVNGFAADQWKVNSRVQVYYGLRYNLVTAPTEVNRWEQIPYHCDCNNFSPRFSIALRAGGDWVMRTSYTVSFGQILPVTFQQIRYNLPNVRYLQIQSPDLLRPLAGVDLNSSNIRSSPTFFSPGMVSPYSHQYNLTFERRAGQRYLFRVSYVGSRSFKALNVYIQNRAVPVPGLPLITANIDQRRPDARYYEVKTILNGGIAYLDAGQISIERTLHRGLAGGAVYTFGKAIDEGADYTSTAANRDQSRARSQWQYESAKDRKGLSNFDSTHALSLYYSYDLPKFQQQGWLGPIAGNWQLSGAGMLKSGTPLTLYMGSDSPGFGNVDGGSSDRPNILDPSILGKTLSNPTVTPQILRRDRFGFLEPGQPRGSLGRGTFRKAGIVNYNAALSRQWRLGARGEHALTFRAEAINLANHPQFDEPQRNYNATAFGKITNTLNEGRVIQLVLRLSL
ncbi:MAG: hypothetical protein EXQ52_04405 [Bryobacterales bacterium]|nr:hypothetical protein [Bryobacterales bacterium]